MTTAKTITTADALSKLLAELLRGREDAAEKLRELLSGLESLDGFRVLSSALDRASADEAYDSSSPSPSTTRETASRVLQAYAADQAKSSGLRYAAIVAMLGDEKAHRAQADDPRAPTELERELRRHIETFAAEIDGLNDANPGTPREDGLLAWDASFARYVERLGSEGGKLAKKVRANAVERMLAYDSGKLSEQGLWRLWLVLENASAPLFAINLARVLWREIVGTQLHKQPALVFPIHVEVTRVHSRMFRREEPDGQRLLEFDHGVTLAPSVEMAAIDELLMRGVDLLGSVTAHKALRWEVTEGHTRVMRGETDARRLHVPGGWSALAEKLHITSKRSTEELRAIVYAQAHLRFNLPNAKAGNLLSYEESRAVGRRQGSVTIILGDTLLPDYVFYLRDQVGNTSRLAREAQRLVPMVELPPLVGRPNEHGQQATLSMIVVREMRERAAELVKHGGVLIALDRFAELACAAGLKASMLLSILNRWTQDGDDAPMFLKQVEFNRYTLGDTHIGARHFLEEAGRRSLAGTKAGIRRVESRTRARLKLGKGE